MCVLTLVGSANQIKYQRHQLPPSPLKISMPAHQFIGIQHQLGADGAIGKLDRPTDRHTQQRKGPSARIIANHSTKLLLHVRLACAYRLIDRVPSAWKFIGGCI